jgi:hypothetical protein
MPDSLYMPQPDRLCTDGGDPDNMSWFAFVAGSDSIALTVTPSNCTTAFANGAPKYRGIQAGLMDGCDLQNPSILACYNECDVNLLTPRPATIAVGGLIPGQIYYFYVDGCGGSQCDYVVSVDFGNQPFAIDEPDSLGSSLVMDGDTVCSGINAFDVTLAGVDSLIDYNWRISPPTDSMPDRDADGWGELINTNLQTISVPLIDPGAYTFMAWADNDCDQTDSLFFSVIVADLDPVVFDTVEICIEDFPYLGPFQNGVSWMSGSIFSPGFVQETVMLTGDLAGCSYEESVYVESITSGRTDMVVAACPDSYPIVIGSTITINNAADGGFYTFGQTTVGCDSMVNVIIEEQNLYGDFQLGNCSPGAIDLAYHIDSTAYPVDSIIFTWLDDTNGTVGTDSILTASAGASYSVTIDLYRDGIPCSFTIGPIMADASAFALGTPVFIDPDEDICPDEIATIYQLATDGNEDSIWWYMPEIDLTWAGTGTATIDWSSVTTSTLCVFTTSACGVSDTTCIDISRLPIPDVSFDVADSVCVGEQLVATYTGDNGVILLWNTSGAAPVDLGSDQYGFEWSDDGLYQLSLTGTAGACSDTVETAVVTVQPMQAAPAITCTGDQGMIVLEWPMDDCITSVAIDTNGVQIYTGSSNTYTLDGLSSGQQVTFNMVVQTECGCWSDLQSMTTCSATPCGAVDIQIDGIFGQMCTDAMGGVIDYDPVVTGASVSTDGVWSGDFIDPVSGAVIVDSLGPGAHVFYYTIVEGQCTYTDSVMLELFDSPQLVLDTDNPDCYDDSTGTVSLSATGGQGPYTFFINGSVTQDLDDIDLAAGDYDIEVVDDNNCDDGESIQIEIPSQPDLMISGSGDIIEGGSDQLSINTTAFVNHVIDSIFWESMPGGMLCEGCTEVSVSPDAQTSYLVTVFFDDGCLVEETYFLSVRPETQLAWSNVINPSSSVEGNRYFRLGANTELQLDYFVIYDRWGEQVFSLEDTVIDRTADLWDGTFKGRPAIPGVYVMSFQVNDGNEVITKTGTITVIR